MNDDEYDRYAGVSVVLAGLPRLSTYTWSKTCQVPIRPSVSTRNSVGRSCGSVTRRKRCHGVAPSMRAASSTDGGRFCSAAQNISMTPPVEVQTTSTMIEHIATLGPASQSHQDSPRKPWPASAAGGFAGSPSARWKRPRGSANQLGPSTPNSFSAAFTVPVLENRNRNTTEIATELVTVGK